MGAAATESPSPLRALGFAAVAGFTATLAGGGVLALLYDARPLRAVGLSAGLCGALLLLVLRVPLEALATRVLGTRGRVAWWLAMATGAAALALSTAADLHHTLHASWRFAYGDPHLWECEPWAFGVSAVTTVAAACWAFAPFPPRSTLRGLAAFAAAAAVALTIGVAARGARAAAIDRYVSSLPRLGESAQFPAERVAENIGGVSTRVFDDRVPGTPLTLRRYTFDDGGGCAMRVGAAPLAPAVLRRDEALVSCGAIALRRDERHQALMVTSTSTWSSQTRAFDLDSGAPWGEDRAMLATFAGQAAAPRSWVVAALLALGLGLVAALSKPETRWWSSRAGWRQGTLGADGVIALDGDGSRVTCPFGAGLAAGPVVLRGYEAAAGGDGPFRAGPSVGTVAREDVRAGTAVSVAAELEARTDARLAYVLFAALVAVAATAPVWVVGLAP